MGMQGQNRIILLGRNIIQNALLCEFLQSELGWECTLLDELPTTHEKNSKEQTLFLFDVSSYPWNKLIDFLNNSKSPAESACIGFLNMQEDDAYDYLLEQEGLKGIFFEDTTQEQLVKGIKTIFKGECWFSRKMMARYLESHRHEGVKQSCVVKARLTKKEQEILKYIAQGDTNEAISKRLSVSVHTIKTHVYNIFRKIGVNNRIQAVKWMSESGSELVDKPRKTVFPGAPGLIN